VSRFLKAVVVVAGLVLMVVFAAVGADEDILKIGLLGPYSGTQAWEGYYQERCAKTALEILGWEFAGFPIKLYKADNACSVTESAAAARKLAEVDKVTVVFGGMCSSSTLAQMPVLEEYGIPNITCASTNPKITELSGIGGDEWHFRINAHDGMMAGPWSEFIVQDQGVKRLVILAVNNDWGRGAAAVYPDKVASLGGEVLDTFYFEYAQPDFTPLLTRIKTLNADGVLLVMVAQDAVRFFRQVQQMGLDVRLFGRGNIATPEFLSIADDPSIAVTQGVGVTEAGLWAPTLDTPENLMFVEKYREMWDGEQPGMDGGPIYYALKALKLAVEMASSIEKEAIREALEQVEFESGMGTIKFDLHHQAHPYIVFNQVAQTADGEWQIVLGGYGDSSKWEE